jgi:ribonuclease HI
VKLRCQNKNQLLVLVVTSKSYGAFFMEHLSKCGVGVVFYISVLRLFKICYTLGGGTNTKVEPSVLWALLAYATSLNLRKNQIFGDSKAVVDRVNGKNHMQVLRARNLMVQIQTLFSTFEWYSVSHIPKALNVQADKLSKEALELDKGAFIFQELYEDQLQEEMNFRL